LGARAGCCGLRFASAFFTAKEASGKKELNPSHPWRGIAELSYLAIIINFKFKYYLGLKDI